MIIKYPENLCIICGSTIPEGKLICPTCGATEADMFEGVKPEKEQPEFKVDDAIEQAYHQGYSMGFNEGVKHTCEIKQDNERLKRENAMLRSQIESRMRVDDIDSEYE